MGFKRSRVQIPPARDFSRPMFCVYILKSEKTGRLYIGSCQNLDERIRRHNLGHSKATRHGIPWTALHSERFATRAEAVRKETYYKTGHGGGELAPKNF